MLSEERLSDKYAELVAKAMTELKKKGFDDFKADLPDFDKPGKFTLQGGEDGAHIMPDITASKDGKIAYFEISSTKGDSKMLISKWKLLSQVAKMKDGYFGILIPKGTIRFTEDVMSRHQLIATPIRL